MRFFRRLNVRLFVSYLVVVVIGGLTVLATTRLLAPSIFTDELQGVRLRIGQTESGGPGPGGPGGPSGTSGTIGPGGASGGSEGGGGVGSTIGPGGEGDGSGGSGPRSTVGPGDTGGHGSGSGGSGDSTGSTGGGSDGPNAAATLFQADPGDPTELTDEAIRTAFLDSLDQALLFGLVVSLVIAVIVAALVSGRIMRPIGAIRTAARRLANGHYDERVPVPSDPQLADLAEDFNELASTLQESEARRMQLVSEVTHELRTPLTTIQGYMEGLIDGVIEPGDEVYASVADEATRLQRVAADLSMLSRIQEGAISLHMKPVDLAAVAATVAGRLRPQFDDQGVLLHVDSAVELPVVGDPDRLAQVFTNLIGNALTHTPGGGTVSVEARRMNDRAQVLITDTGQGISAEDLERIFDRFYRAGQDPRATGTGIGLTIARGITRSHGGDVVAASDGLGQGATFTVELPLQA